MRFSKTGDLIIADVYAFMQVIDFAEYERDTTVVELFEKWLSADQEQKQAALQMIRTMNAK